MNETNETFNVSDSMHKFFMNLLEIKDYVKKKYEETKNEDLKEIYERLNLIIQRDNSGNI